MSAPHPLGALLRLVENLPLDARWNARAQTLCEIEAGGERWPVLAISLGSRAADAPVLGLFGGVHGLERIGYELVLAFCHQLLRRLHWDGALQYLLREVRVVAVPLVNPVGLLRGTRANPQGVDLMRNAPVECTEGAPWLLGGQRLGPGLPWYRGPAGAPMEPEAQALCDLVERELLGARFALALDCHSGFGLHDRLWFPHAHTRQPVATLAEFHALASLLDDTLLHHRYVFEPQSRQYLTHGDLWDHLTLRAQARAQAGDGAGTFLALTLEMGSWLWVKKNPRQLFSRHGIFNPLIEHRQHRVLRRHLGLLDFALRATQAHAHWCPDGASRAQQHALGLARWYGPQEPAR